MEYEKKKNKVEAEIEKESKSGKESVKGQEAVKLMEQLLDKVAISEKTSKSEAINSLLSALDINKDDVKSIELEIKFSNGKELKVERDK